jgi:hypothetical protein
VEVTGHFGSGDGINKLGFGTADSRNTLCFTTKFNSVPSETEDIASGGMVVLKVVSISGINVSRDVEGVRGGRKWWQTGIINWGRGERNIGEQRVGMGTPIY